MDDIIEKSAMRKIYLRLLPFAILSYFLAYIDRINVSFAALTMRDDLGISAGAYGFALGTFYWGYFIFEVPSNVIMEKVGARIWIARIMITWGILAGLTALVTGSTSFGIVRFLLGVAEAGFFPGLVLYFTYWFPTYHHARIVSGFLIGLPIAVAGGAPISTALLGLDGLFGLRGWQIMYIAEGVPTVLIGIVTLFVLTDRPAQAKFLTVEEKTWLSAKLDSGTEGEGGGAYFQYAARDVRSEGTAAGAQLFRDRRRKPGDTVLRSANHQVDRRHRQHDGRLADDDPLYFRWDRPGDLGPCLRSYERAALEPAGGLRGLRGWADHRRSDHRLVVGDGGPIDRRVRVLWLEGTVLVDAADVPHGHGGGGFYRMDQFPGQSRRLLRPLVCRCDQGLD